MQWLAIIGKAVVVFAATNIDDILVLTLFFAQKNLKCWHLVVGQYLGLAALIATGLIGFVAGLFIPAKWIGLLGLAPIAIGIKKLIDWKRGSKGETAALTGTASIFAVAAVTFANGGDNIGIYVPLFASSTGLALVVTLLIFGVLLAVWCAFGYFLGRQPAVNRTIGRFGHIIVPFVLIALGAYIIFESRK